MTSHLPNLLLTLGDSESLLSDVPRWALIAAVVTGLVLWLLGHKSLKAGFGLLGILAGGLAGYVVPSALGIGVHPGWTAGLGAVIGLVIGVATFRVSISVTMSAVLAVVGCLTVFAVVAPQQARELHDNPLGDSGPGLSVSAGAPGESGVHEPTEDAVSKVKDWLGAQTQGPGGDLLREKAEALRDTSERLVRRVRPVWNDLPRADRTAIALGTVGGAALGLGFGVFFPKKSAAVVTACAGAMLWLPATVELAERSNLRVPFLMSAGLGTWLGVVAAATIIGTAIQWRMGRKRADKA